MFIVEYAYLIEEDSFDYWDGGEQYKTALAALGRAAVLLEEGFRVRLTPDTDTT